MPSLGRLVEFDERSRGFDVAALPGVAATLKVLRTNVSARVSVRHRTWVRLDQGDLGSCVGNGWTAARATSPGARVKGSDEQTAVSLYSEACGLDDVAGGWPPEDTGSSVLAGAKAAVRRGWFSSYSWAFTLDSVVAAAVHGPVVIGIPWYNSMFEPVAGPGGSSWLEVDRRSGLAGGHCLLVRGVSVGGRGVPYFLLRNSWGASWGDGGDVCVAVADLADLLRADGEACIPLH